MYLEPANDMVLVLDAPEDATIDGIELPGNMKQKEMMFGTVLSIGPLVTSRTAPKDQICYGPYAGKMIILDGTELRMLKEAQIEGYIRREVKNESQQDVVV